MTPASGLFSQSFVQAGIKENIKASRHCLCEKNPPRTGGFLQQAGNTENVSIWWRHHSDIFSQAGTINVCKDQARAYHMQLHVHSFDKMYYRSVVTLPILSALRDINSQLLAIGVYTVLLHDVLWYKNAGTRHGWT